MSVPISLVITVYNRERYLAQAIESVLAQTFTDFELLIWDDGSSDRSVEIARNYEQQDKRIKVTAAPHTGRGQALRNAIATTTGKYLGIVDSDDLLACEALEETAALLNNQPQVGMVYTDYLVIDEIGAVKGLGKRCQIPYSFDRLLLDFMTFHFRLMRRSLYDTVGGVDPEFKAAQDYDLCLRLSEVTEIVQIKKPLYLYRNHADNISHTSQFEQIHFTQLAITRALSRRGMASDWDLEVRVQPQYLLRRKRKLAVRFSASVWAKLEPPLCARL
ncbi:MAG: glycosyltransferase [Hydrococcus sp. RM1_1_31]|nr:glycosyltransferase [Hydrococcus sp. RM1_1_31]